jgi:hypothetical protein
VDVEIDSRALPMKAVSMKHASYFATRIVSSAGKARRPPRQKGLFTIILEAIYDSRRRQTENTLRRYQHLIGEAEHRADEPESYSGK